MSVNEAVSNSKNDCNCNQNNPKNFGPEKVPTVVELAATSNEVKNESVVKKVNDNCCIVEKGEMKVIGIKTVMTPESMIGFISVAEKYLKNGSIDLLEKMFANKNPGKYIGVSTNIQGGGAFEYIIGIEVDSFENLPEGLPVNTATCICPSGMFAKMNKIAGTGRYEVWDYFTGGFRKETNYVYDKQRLPYQIFNKSAEMLHAYEPVKIPATEKEKYDTINYQIVTLPELGFAGIKSEAKYGIDVISEYFVKYKDDVDRLPNRKPYIQDFIGFGLYENNIMYSCFGAQVSDFDNLPEGISTVTLKGGLYVHLTQLEINNDNPAALYEVINEVFFKENPQYMRDSDNCDLVRFHQGHSASIFVPIKKEV